MQKASKFVFVANTPKGVEAYNDIRKKSNMLVNTRCVIVKQDSAPISVGNITITPTDIYGMYLKNSIQCLEQGCGSVIISLFEDHLVWCKCGKCRIDGGNFKLIRKGTGRYKELSVKR